MLKLGRPTSFLRWTGLFILFVGFGFLVTYMYRVVNSGEIIGTYPMMTRQVQTPGDFIAMLRRSGDLLIGEETHQKIISTDLFSFAADTGEVEIRLIIKKKWNLASTNVISMSYPFFFLMDENGKEVFRREVRGGLSAMAENKVGLNSKSIYFIGTFRPEVSKKYRLVVSLDDLVYTAIKTSVEVEVRRNTEPYDYHLIAGFVSLILFGAVVGYLTRPN